MVPKQCVQNNVSKTMGSHLDGTFWACQSAIEKLKESGNSSIIKVSSTAALAGNPADLAYSILNTQYSAMKGGDSSQTESIAIDCCNPLPAKKNAHSLAFVLSR